MDDVALFQLEEASLEALELEQLAAQLKAHKAQGPSLSPEAQRHFDDFRNWR